MTDCGYCGVPLNENRDEIFVCACGYAVCGNCWRGDMCKSCKDKQDTLAEEWSEYWKYGSGEL